MVTPRSFACLLAVLCWIHAAGWAQEEPAVRIRADYPGGNVIVKDIEGDTVHVAPDLRGGRPWFYWSFEATVDTDRTLEFVFPEGTMRCVGMQGPAICADGGEAWDWLGAEGAAGSSFSYSFEKGVSVRFSVTIPYLQSDLDEFLERNRSNRHLAQRELTKTHKGRPVDLLQIGRPGKGRRTVLMTARHHACESMASFVLEGFLQAAISDSKEGKAFRKRHALFVVPLVDTDGVQDGDQGKNRQPHDHNRDYTDEPLYATTKAIMELGRSTPIHFALDWHCPTLWMDYHQVIYFPGPKDTPKHNHTNVTRFAKRLKAQLPRTAPRGCLVMLKSKRDGTHFSDHFAGKPGMVMSTTLEFPYAPKGKVMDPASCVKYGAAVLRAWNRCEFLADGE